MNDAKNSQQGLIKEIILVVIALAILSYFGFSFSSFIHNPSVNALWIPAKAFFSWFSGTFIGILRNAWSVIVTAYEAFTAFLKSVQH